MKFKLINENVSGYDACYSIVKKARTSSPVDAEALEDAKEKFGYDLYKQCLDDVLSEVESKQINEELWNSTRVIDLVSYYLDRNNYPINTLANLIKNQMEKEGSKLPYNVTDFYDALYMAVDRYNAQFDDDLDESKSIREDVINKGEIVDELDDLPHVSIVFEEGDYIKIKGKWRTTSRMAHMDYINIMTFLNEKLGKGNFELVYESNDSRDKGKGVSCTLRLELKDSLKESKSIKTFGAKAEKLTEDSWPKLLPIEEIPDNRKWQYSVGGVDVPYTSYEDAMAHLKDDYNIEDYREELQKFIDKETGRPHTFFVDATFDGRLCIDISWGDWKHEHGYADYLVRKFFNDKGLGIDIEVDTTAEDGTDAYSATHYYEIDDLMFSGRPVEESLREGLNDYRFYVSCNDGPEKLIRTVAENEEKAINYVKKMYAQEHSTYADDRANKWNIKNLDESLSESSSNMPYKFFYSAVNSTLGYDFEEFAKSLGAKKVYGRYKGTAPGSYFYLVPSEEVYNELKKVAKREYGVEMQRLTPFNSEEYPKLQYINEALNGYKMTISKDGETFDDYASAYEEDGAIQQMKNKYGKDIEVKNIKISKVIKEAHYGGAYDIADEAYFTKEDLVEFAEDVIDAIDRQYDLKFDINELELYKGVLYLGLVSENGVEMFHEQRINMRKIKQPKDLNRYLDEFITAFKFQIDDNASYLYEDTYNSNEFDTDEYDDDNEVTAGKTFIESGYEYKWLEKVGATVHLDFDNWAVWSAENLDDDVTEYFVVDEDTGFIDWGPVDTAEEALEFLQSKVDDYNEDEDDYGDFIDFEEDMNSNFSFVEIVDERGKESHERHVFKSVEEMKKYVKQFRLEPSDIDSVVGLNSVEELFE